MLVQAGASSTKDIMRAQRVILRKMHVLDGRRNQSIFEVSKGKNPHHCFRTTPSKKKFFLNSVSCCSSLKGRQSKLRRAGSAE